jgi:hypothetical protein
MKIFCLIASLILSFSSISQKSYYFSDPLPSVAAKVATIDAKWHGTYASGTGITYKIDANGISIVSTSISSISRESIRESSKYDVRGGFIFGVIENDSLPCVLDDERYYFGVHNVDIFVGTGSLNVLTKTKTSSVYILNVYENGNYVPMQFSFKGNKLTVSYFDYDSETTAFDFIAEKKDIAVEQQKLVILSPSVDEFGSLETKGIFADEKVFKR